MSESLVEISQKGWTLIQRGKLDQACQLLYGSVQEHKDNPSIRGYADVLSMYGFCVAMLLHKRKEGIQFCKRAISLDRMNSRHYYLLGQIYQTGNAVKLAIETFRKGLSVDPKDKLIKAALDKVDRRQKPVLGFLPRRNPVNRMLGQLRHNLTQKEDE